MWSTLRPVIGIFRLSWSCCRGSVGNVFLSDQQVRQTIDTALPVLGTLGLILIVLEASLDLDVHWGNLSRLAQACWRPSSRRSVCHLSSGWAWSGFWA